MASLRSEPVGRYVEKTPGRIKIRPVNAEDFLIEEEGRSMQTTPCPSCGRTDGNHSHLPPVGSSERGTGSMKCVICSGPLADHEIGEHAARVVERLAALGFPTPVNVGMP